MIKLHPKLQRAIRRFLITSLVGIGGLVFLSGTTYISFMVLLNITGAERAAVVGTASILVVQIAGLLGASINYNDLALSEDME